MEKDDLVKIVNRQAETIDDLAAENLDLAHQVQNLKAKLRQYERDDRHQIELREDGYTIQHPMACRPNLFDCVFNLMVREDFTEPPTELGRFYLDFDGADLTVGERVPDA